MINIWRNIFFDNFGMLRVGWWILGLFVAVPILIAALLFGTIRQIDHHYQQKYCEPRLSSYGREGKFVDYNYWSYDCLAKTSDGSYVPINSLINTKD